MNLVELYSKDDCPLCDVAREVLVNIQQKYPFELKIVKIHDGDPAYDRFKERIPVIHINGKFAFQYKVSEHDFITKLQTA
ncbi:MAG TPA: glutaredoxin family protein [Bacteroidota bacterium]|jgi:hypothetical protein|nr:glutaredoxin family protein [Bacteroidota bacterium]